MYYVGIDIAKYKHDCFIFTSEGEIVLESFTFENTREGFSKLKLILDALDHSQKIKTGLEATGIYGKNLKLFLSSIGYDFDELNPLQVKRFTNALSNRKTKTDKIDASQIARFVSTGASRTYVYSSYHTEALKQLTRARNSLIINSVIQPCISAISAASIIGEFGDFSRFDNAKQLCAFCGVEPSIYQSGTSYHEGKMVKHGSSNLRRTLFNVVPYIIMHNETFKTFYDKKRSEGKAYRVAQSHVVKKLLRVIFTLEMTGSTFAPSKLY